MAGMKPLRIPNPRDVLALLRTGFTYWLIIVPAARSELQHWKSHAQEIPDPILKRHALDKLSKEALNPEAAAFFAILAPRTNRRNLIRLIVAYQVMYDYLDAVNEEPAFAQLRDGLQLHCALVDAVRITQTTPNYYPHDRQSDDGGYLKILVSTCRDALTTFPSRTTMFPALIVATKRCGEAQARNHAVLVEDYEQLIHWSEQQSSKDDYLWWEVAAAGISCLGIHALFAAAATPNTDRQEAIDVDRAYFPSVCAISALLDSLIDLPHDAGTSNHRFAAHYMSSEHAATRYKAIVGDAENRFTVLRNPQRHRIILAGIAGYYLSAAEAHTHFANPVTKSTASAAGPIIGLILIVMRVRRWAHSLALSKKKQSR